MVRIASTVAGVRMLSIVHHIPGNASVATAGLVSTATRHVTRIGTVKTAHYSVAVRMMRCVIMWQGHVTVHLAGRDHHVIDTAGKVWSCRLMAHGVADHHLWWNVRVWKAIIGWELCAARVHFLRCLTSNTAVDDAMCNPSILILDYWLEKHRQNYWSWIWTCVLWSNVQVLFQLRNCNPGYISLGHTLAAVQCWLSLCGLRSSYG